MGDRAERFFVWVWRINGVLVLLVVLFLLGMFMASNFGLTSQADRPEPLARVGDTDLAEGDLSLGRFNGIAGTDYLYAALNAPPSKVAFGSGGGAGSTHNALFLETSTKEAHWLLDGNAQTLPSFLFLTDPPGSPYAYRDDDEAKREQITLAILLEIETTPASGSGATRRLAVASPDGRNVSTIAEPIDELLGHHSVSKTSVLVFYSTRGTAKVLDLDPTARQVRSDTVLDAKP